jgi:hypothetical protein
MNPAQEADLARLIAAFPRVAAYYRATLSVAQVGGHYQVWATLPGAPPFTLSYAPTHAAALDQLHEWQLAALQVYERTAQKLAEKGP